jgi:hypothetical protein
VPSADESAAASPAQGKRSLCRAIVRSPVVRFGVLAVAIGLAVVNLERTPQASMGPALVALVPWIVGKYVLCPLRWHALSQSGRSRRWHLRAYAESELLGLVTPSHAGADVWRVHRLEKVGRRRSCAIAEVALDRLVGAVGLTAFVLLAGASLPPQLLVAALAIAAVAALVGFAVARLRPQLLPRRELPPARTLVRGVLISVVYQLTILVLLLGVVRAVGHTVDPLALLGVFGAAQVAGIIPGVHGASPREGALVVGLAALGVPWTAALGAIALLGLLAWGPALLLGGGSFLARRLATRRALALA